MEISPLVIGIISFIVLLILLFLKMPVGIVLFLISFFGIWIISGLPQALHILGNIPYKTSVTYTWSLIPLFMLMGQFAFFSGLGTDLFKFAFSWLGHLPGGLAITTIGTSAGFSAVCGDNIAGAITMTSVCLPEMRKYKYDDSLSLGCVCSGGILSFLIPPSLGFILYGILANVSISTLFIAGIIPGILCAILYVVVIFSICRVNPEKGPLGPRVNWAERMSSLRYTWGLLLILIIVFGGIYSGFITATEAGGLGAFAALLVGLIKGKMSWKNFKSAILSTLDSTGMVFLLLLGAWTFAPFLALTTIPQALISVTGEWSPALILLFVLVFFFVGGLIFDSTILMVITVPIFLPIWMAAEFDLIWFGVIVMLIVVVGNNTPPVGLVVYAVSGMVPDVPVGRIFKGVTPFIPAVFAVIVLVIFVPQIALFLPSLVR